MSAATLTPQRQVFMKNVFKMLGIVALVAAIGFLMAACDDDTTNNAVPPPNPLVGTWQATDGSAYKFNSDGTFEGSEYGTPVMKGTYTTSGGSMTIIVNQIYYSGQWYTRTQFKTLGATDAQIAQAFPTETSTYTINGTTLIFDGVDVFTKIA